MFGVLPIYEYSVMARNYGISMLLFFAFAAIYNKRQAGSLWIGLLLALLANTNVHSLILTGLLATVWIWDEFDATPRRSLRMLIRKCGPGILLTIGGVILAAVTVWPEHSMVQSPVKFTLSEAISAFFTNVILPGRNFIGIFPTKHAPILGSAMAWILVLGLARRRLSSIALLAGFALVGTFANLVYVIDLRHQGIVFAFAICLYWMSQSGFQSHSGLIKRKVIAVNPAYVISIFVIFPIMMGNHIYKGYRAILTEIKEERSSSASFGQFLNTHAEFRDAIVMAEPDFVLEALPYYAANPIYLPRESRFGKVFKLTTASKPRLSLGELLEISKSIKEREKKPVLIALAIHLIDLDGIQDKETSYAHLRSFTWSAKERADFLSATHKVARFANASTDENYIVYQLN
jgi:hypothetical protein